MLSNANAMIVVTDFEKAGGGGGYQKRFLELPRAKARQLKMSLMMAYEFFVGCFFSCLVNR